MQIQLLANMCIVVINVLPVYVLYTAVTTDADTTWGTRTNGPSQQLNGTHYRPCQMYFLFKCRPVIVLSMSGCLLPECASRPCTNKPQVSLSSSYHLLQ